MEFYPDFQELLKLFNDHQVEYAIVGGYAVGYHGAPRYTGDLDILVRPSEENAGRILAALSDFGFGSLGLKREDFSRPDFVVQLGMPPVRVDLITSITGVATDVALRNQVTDFYGSVRVGFLSKSDLLTNKRTTGRAKDLADVEALGGELPAKEG